MLVDPTSPHPSDTRNQGKLTLGEGNEGYHLGKVNQAWKPAGPLPRSQPEPTRFHCEIGILEWYLAVLTATFRVHSTRTSSTPKDRLAKTLHEHLI